MIACVAENQEISATETIDLVDALNNQGPLYWLTYCLFDESVFRYQLPVVLQCAYFWNLQRPLFT